MEKRLGIIAIVVENKDSVPKVNELLSRHADLIQARMGLPRHEENVALISLVVEGDTDQIGSLTGRLGKLQGVRVKSVLVQSKGEKNDTGNEAILHQSGKII